MQVALEHLLESVCAHGLGEIIVHPGFEALLAVAADGTGGHGDDEDVADLRI